MTLPKRLIVEYEDGSTKGIEFSQLDKSIRLELSRRGLSPPPSEVPEHLSHFLLLRWKSGWQEVIGVDKSPVELLRYYILERMEEVGRLALEVKGDYPILFTIKRLPKELESLMIIGREEVKVYHLEPKTKREEGDKIEHVEFDKAERHFQPESDGQAEAWIGKIREALRTELDKRNLTSEKLTASNQSQRIMEYKELSKALGLRAKERQEDVYCFIQFMIENLRAL
jgi:hypothetical protein